MRLLIYGAGGLGRGTYDLLRRKNHGRWDEFLFVDDTFSDPGFCMIGCVHFNSGDPRINPLDSEFLITVGEPYGRYLIQQKIEEKGFKLATYIDPDSWIASDVKIEEGAVVLAGCVLDVNVTVKKNTIIQHQVVIGHDTVIGDGSVISSNVAIGGNVTIGKSVFLGLQSVIEQGLTIKDRAIISMGAVVYKDVKEDETLVGNPARVTKGKDGHKVFC